MERYVALLRGINVGGRTVKMADLREAFAAMGFPGSETVLQSGNVIFSSNEPREALKPRLERGLEQSFQYPAGCRSPNSNTLLVTARAKTTSCILWAVKPSGVTKRLRSTC